MWSIGLMTLKEALHCLCHNRFMAPQCFLQFLVDQPMHDPWQKNSKIILAAHFKDLSKIFPTGTNFLQIRWTTTKIMEILDDFPDNYLFPSTFTISLVLLINFERIKLEMPDWSHFKDLFNIFKTVTNFMSIPWKTTNLWAVKHRHFHGNFEEFSIIFFHPVLWSILTSLLEVVSVGQYVGLSNG